MGVFIVAVDGPDHSGKSTVTGLLINSLRKIFPEKIIRHTVVPSTLVSGILVKVLRNSADKVDDRVFALAYAADHLHHYNLVVKPLEEDNREYILVQERSLLTTYLYQSIIGKVDMSWIDELNKFDKNIPDVNIILKIDIKELLNRKQIERRDSDKFETDDHLNSQVNLYYNMPSHLIEKFNVQFVNASLSPDYTVQQCVDVIKSKIGGTAVQQELFEKEN